MSAAEAQHYRAELERFERRWPDERHMLDQGASLLCPWIDAFTRHPGLLDPMEDLLGPNLLVWGVSLRLKEADGKTFAGWHQDTAYCDIKPIVVIAALALSDCGEDAGCLRVIPAPIAEPLPHREHFGTDSLLTREQQIDAPVDEGPRSRCRWRRARRSSSTTRSVIPPAPTGATTGASSSSSSIRAHPRLAARAARIRDAGAGRRSLSPLRCRPAPGPGDEPGGAGGVAAQGRGAGRSALPRRRASHAGAGFGESNGMMGSAAESGYPSL